MSAPSSLFAQHDPHIAARLHAAAVLAAVENANGWVRCFGQEPFTDGDEARHDDIHNGALAAALGRGLDSEQLSDAERAALWPVYLPMLRAEIARLQRLDVDTDAFASGLLCDDPECADCAKGGA